MVFLAIYRKYAFILLSPTHSAGPCFETMVSLIFAEALVQQALGESYWAGAPVALEITQQEYGAKYQHIYLSLWHPHLTPTQVGFLEYQDLTTCFLLL